MTLNQESVKIRSTPFKHGRLAELGLKQLLAKESMPQGVLRFKSCTFRHQENNREEKEEFG